MLFIFFLEFTYYWIFFIILTYLRKLGLFLLLLKFLYGFRYFVFSVPFEFILYLFSQPKLYVSFLEKCRQFVYLFKIIV
ncbi:hypothetical protein BVH74_15155 [Halopseudomonas phragmitis]|uniref:Uncharacterized protein n=1 Tax=Halopseudomonas phragmitis TaxID=1931241 RepID=A0A1V0B7U8_9GAMM|nr:hypothetical protein BVH74_15155 [Halopseudomonas phragmitis]